MSVSGFLRLAARRPFLSGFIVTGAWSLGVYHDSSKVPRRTITTTHTVPDVFVKSRSHQIVNPRQTPHAGDSRSTTLKVTNGDQVSKQQILTWFTDGLFQNWIFAPEGVLMNVVKAVAGKEFTHISTTASTNLHEIWSSKQLKWTPPPLQVSTKLFGTFQVVDVWESGSPDAECGIDLAFGSDQGSFAGCHRLSVKRVEEGGEEGPQSLLLTFSCVVCNPVNEKGMDLNDSLPFLESLHNLYSEHLFRAAVGHVMRGLERERA